MAQVERKDKFNVLAVEETLEELDDIKKELNDVLSSMDSQERSGHSIYFFGNSTIIYKKDRVVRVKFTDISNKMEVDQHRDYGIREDDEVWFIEGGFDNLDEPRKVKGITVSAKRSECVVDFKVMGKSEETLLSGEGSLKKEFNKNSIKTQLSMIDRLMSVTKQRKIPPGAIPFVFRILELPELDLGTTEKWMTETFKRRGPDPSQERAIKQSLNGPAISILRGPPGTGKTSVIAEIALQLISNGRYVLITSQTNSALDNIVSRIIDSKEGVNLIRIVSTPQIIPDSSVRRYSSEELINTVRSNSTQFSHNDSRMRQINEKLHRSNLLRSLEKGKPTKALWKKCEEAFGKLNFSDKKVLYLLSKNYSLDHRTIWAEKKYIEESNKELENEFVKSVVKTKLSAPCIIAATCVGLYSNRISKPIIDQVVNHYLTIGTVILDEASKANRSESLIPLAFSEKAVVVGDERQLPPYMEWSVATKNRNPESLFENLTRLPWLEPGKTPLNSNYRSHKSISDFISRIFYGDSLVSRRIKSFNLTEGEETAVMDILGSHLLFIEHQCSETLETSHNGEFIKGAFQNREEAKIIVDILRMLKNRGITEDKIAVISPYRSQVRLLRRLANEISPSYEIDTVDSFQGRERPLVFVSLTRANEKGNIGFVRDVRRLNVMFSRAEDFLIVIGNSDVFMKVNGRDDQFDPLLGQKFSEIFQKIMEEFRENGRIVSDFNAIYPSFTE